MTFSIARYNSDGHFNEGHLKEHVYAVPPRTVDDLVARFPADDTSVDTRILRHLEECHAAHCLPSCNRRKPLQTPSVITRHPASFDGNLYLENLTSPICCINLRQFFYKKLPCADLVRVLLLILSTLLRTDFLLLLSWCGVLRYKHIALNV